MLNIIGIKKRFGANTILSDVSFDAGNGLLTILEGENGAGKSTLFNILSGNIFAEEGKILLHNVDISPMSALKRSSILALLKQDPKASSSPALTVLENCALAWLKEKKASLKMALRADVKEQIILHLNALELNYEHLLDRRMGELSGGQRQIFAFAMATMIKPRLLLLDEPTAALDEKSSHLLMRLIKSLVAKWHIPAVMISHDHALNKHYGDALRVLKNGVIQGSQ